MSLSVAEVRREKQQPISLLSLSTPSLSSSSPLLPCPKHLICLPPFSLFPTSLHTILLPSSLSLQEELDRLSQIRASRADPTGMLLRMSHATPGTDRAYHDPANPPEPEDEDSDQYAILTGSSLRLRYAMSGTDIDRATTRPKRHIRGPRLLWETLEVGTNRSYPIALYVSSELPGTDLGCSPALLQRCLLYSRSYRATPSLGDTGIDCDPMSSLCEVQYRCRLSAYGCATRCPVLT
eukprot:1812374-Rhodomonas_salina.2